jgi:4-hydroxybenzoate polyprenyltransferase/phosphoserine phosphatase
MDAAAMDRAADPIAPQRGAAQDAQVPLVVDLDGTLLRTNTLVESVLVLARTHPLSLLLVPLWLANGRAHLKARVAALAIPDARALPVNRELVEYLRAQKRSGRRLVLATGADIRVARAVADGLGLFDAVMASDSTVNLTGERKRERLLAQFGQGGFDYIGNAAPDLPVWAVARNGLLVSSSRRVAEAAQGVTRIERVFVQSRPGIRGWLNAMRAQHWLKNLLLLVPLVAAHELYDATMLTHALLGALCFCLAASGVYLLNDLLDLGADRWHPHKRQRLLASGQLPVGQALMLVPCLWLAAALLATGLAPPFMAALGVYVALMLAYSLRLKDIAIIDTFALAMGYTLRILAGGLAAGIDVSRWLLVCSAALFFGLALLKRYAELVTLRPGMGPGARVRGYRSTDAAFIAGLGAAACCVAVTVLALYPVAEPSPHRSWPVWLLSGLLLFWTGHMWLMAHRGQIHDDPVAFALRNPVSRVFGVLIAIALLMLNL